MGMKPYKEIRLQIPNILGISNPGWCLYYNLKSLCFHRFVGGNKVDTLLEEIFNICRVINRPNIGYESKLASLFYPRRIIFQNHILIVDTCIAGIFSLTRSKVAIEIRNLGIRSMAKKISKNYIDHAAIMNGGTLVYKMTSKKMHDKH